MVWVSILKTGDVKLCQWTRRRASALELCEKACARVRRCVRACVRFKRLGRFCQYTIIREASSR